MLYVISYFVCILLYFVSCFVCLSVFGMGRPVSVGCRKLRALGCDKSKLSALWRNPFTDASPGPRAQKACNIISNCKLYLSQIAECICLRTSFADASKCPTKRSKGCQYHPREQHLATMQWSQIQKHHLTTNNFRIRR